MCIYIYNKLLPFLLLYYIYRTYIISIGHHAKPKRASATAPRRTGADVCRTGVGAESSAGADGGPDRRQSNHKWMDDQAGRRRLANTDSDGGGLVHAADDTPSKNAATRDSHRNFMRQGGDVPGQQQGRGGTVRDKPWPPQQGYDQKETPQATPPTHDQTQNMP